MMASSWSRRTAGGFTADVAVGALWLLAVVDIAVSFRRFRCHDCLARDT
jgi:hypothetical protein